MELKEGYYWILYKGEWQPAEWTRYNEWNLIGTDEPYPADLIWQVGERIERKETEVRD